MAGAQGSLVFDGRGKALEAAHCKALDGPGRGYWASAAMSVVNGVVLLLGSWAYIVVDRKPVSPATFANID